MPFEIIYGDILTVDTDAIVNSTNAFYSGKGGLDRKIHEAAGDDLWEECGRIGRLHKGEAKITDGFGLAPRKIIHTSGPHWKGGELGEIALLEDCYINSIGLAAKEGIKRIAFPLISSRINGFPKSVALTSALEGIREGLDNVDDEVDVKLVIYPEREIRGGDSLMDIANRAAQNFDPHDSPWRVGSDVRQISFSYAPRGLASFSRVQERAQLERQKEESKEGYGYRPVPEWFDSLIDAPTTKNLAKVSLDKSFGDTLSDLMEKRNFSKTKLADELGMSGPGVWKFMTGKSTPNRMTVFGIMIILKLDLEEAEDLLMKAGYCFSSAFYTDLIIKECLEKGFYDRYQIDELLYSLDLQPLPGAILD